MYAAIIWHILLTYLLRQIISKPPDRVLTPRRRECGCSWCRVRHCWGQFEQMLDELVHLSLCRMSIAYTQSGVRDGLLNITPGEKIVGQMLVVILNDGFQLFVDFLGG